MDAEVREILEWSGFECSETVDMNAVGVVVESLKGEVLKSKVFECKVFKIC